MSPTSILCRAQEAYHRGRAADATLENVRAVAMTAALAWEIEAVSAERREARHRRPAGAGDLAPMRDRPLAGLCDRHFSENPDRGFESA